MNMGNMKALKNFTVNGGRKVRGVAGRSKNAALHYSSDVTRSLVGK